MVDSEALHYEDRTPDDTPQAYVVPLRNSVIGVGNYVIAKPLPMGNFMIADSFGGVLPR